jgi:hypothetical protein
MRSNPGPGAERLVCGKQQLIRLVLRGGAQNAAGGSMQRRRVTRSVRAALHLHRNVQRAQHRRAERSVWLHVQQHCDKEVQRRGTCAPQRLLCLPAARCAYHRNCLLHLCQQLRRHRHVRKLPRNQALHAARLSPLAAWCLHNSV